METITEYIDALPEPTCSVAKSVLACVEKSLPTSHGSLVDGHPVWANGSTHIASMTVAGDCVAITILATGDTKEYRTMAEVEPEALNLWLSADDVR